MVTFVYDNRIEIVDYVLLQCFINRINATKDKIISLGQIRMFVAIPNKC